MVNLSSTDLGNSPLARDVLDIITVFSTRLYSKRSHKSLKMIDDLKKNLCEDYNGEEKA